MTQEGWEDTEAMLRKAERDPHPLHAQTVVDARVLGGGGDKSTSRTAAEEALSIEQVKAEEFRLRRESAKEAGIEQPNVRDNFRVPEWWQGERTAAKMAQHYAKVLPKKIGEEVQ